MIEAAALAVWVAAGIAYIFRLRHLGEETDTGSICMCLFVWPLLLVVDLYFAISIARLHARKGATND